jgi:hypothetical protein
MIKLLIGFIIGLGCAFSFYLKQSAELVGTQHAHDICRVQLTDAMKVLSDAEIALKQCRYTLDRVSEAIQEQCTQCRKQGQLYLMRDK